MQKCSETKALYEKLIGAIKAFNHLLPDIKDKDSRAQLKTKQAEIEATIKNLQERTTPPEIKELLAQYDPQVATMERVGILKRGERAITGIDGEKYKLPDKKELKLVLLKEKEKILKKEAQGFGRLRLVPFGMPLETLIEIYGNALRAHFRAGKLFYPKEKPEDPDEPVLAKDFNENKPVWSSDQWIDENKPVGQRGKDICGDIVYYAEKLEKGKKGNGLTKKEFMQKQKEKKSATAGWRILMVETANVIPKEKKGDTIGGRKQIEAGKSADEYLAVLKEKTYEHEQCMSLEDWLIHALVILEDKNQVLDDTWGGGKGCFCRLPGAFNFRSGWLASAGWSRGARRARLSDGNPDRQNPLGGFRPAVEINK